MRFQNTTAKSIGAWLIQVMFTLKHSYNKFFIVAGGRDYADGERVELEINKILGVDGDHTLVCGMAAGADSLGIRVARKHGWRIEKFPADWSTHGKAAGPIRNEEMAHRGDILLAFWDGSSRGTKDMINKGLKHGLEVHVYRY